jgi:hypothetical protein
VCDGSRFFLFRQLGGQRDIPVGTPRTSIAKLFSRQTRLPSTSLITLLRFHGVDLQASTS